MSLSEISNLSINEITAIGVGLLVGYWLISKFISSSKSDQTSSDPAKPQKTLNAAICVRRRVTRLSPPFQLALHRLDDSNAALASKIFLRLHALNANAQWVRQGTARPAATSAPGLGLPLQRP
jgi:hypothetical protein